MGGLPVWFGGSGEGEGEEGQRRIIFLCGPWRAADEWGAALVRSGVWFGPCRRSLRNRPCRNSMVRPGRGPAVLRLAHRSGGGREEEHHQERQGLTRGCSHTGSPEPPPGGETSSSDVPVPTPSTTLVTSTTTTTSSAPATTTTGGGCTAGQWEQCDGIGFTGCKTCASPYTCNYINDYYSQASRSFRRVTAPVGAALPLTLPSFFGLVPLRTARLLRTASMAESVACVVVDRVVPLVSMLSAWFGVLVSQETAACKIFPTFPSTELS